MNRIVMTLAGLLLIVGSVLKAHQMLTEPIVSKGLWESWIFFLITVPLELSLGVWLVSGLFRKAGSLLGVLSFGFFVGVTAYKAITGELSCGCFGRIHVNPWITLLTIDVPLFVLLLIFFPRREKLLPPPWPHPFHCLAVAIPACFFIGALVPTLYFNKVPYKIINPNEWETRVPTVKQVNDDPNETTSILAPDTEPNITVEINDVNVIEPISDATEITPPVIPDTNDTTQPQIPDINDPNLPEWTQMVLHSDIGEKLFTGAKIVVFYHYNCDDCEVAIPLYSEYSSQFASDQSLQFALISGPPHAPEGKDVVPDDTTALLGKLDQSRDWLFESPIVLLLIDGELIKWWQADKYPDLDQLLQAMLSAE